MNDPEYVLSSNGKHYVDVSVTTSLPYRYAVIDPRQYISTAALILSQLNCVRKTNLDLNRLSVVAEDIVYSLMNYYIHSRKAWVHGNNVGAGASIEEMRKAFCYDMESHNRNMILVELSDNDNSIASNLLISLIHDIIATLDRRMSTNHYTLYMLKKSWDKKTYKLEDHGDWRVIQWTRTEEDLIRKKDDLERG